ncbi:hypothetical protein G8A07_01430 [Roseateles sp. DAIF2]|uniref:hypothetical protein n=1 Tax=Roseateles sp. DAIF2 TaxID=2714952 RepID=UPI0018A2C5F5|nr:hypothetical protein [Roseateles sp. DAIF2]QPF71721.1 hypothetical protein G8A07_01430 [Roseateles sp. DAIF2]
MRFTPALRFFRKSSLPAEPHDPADLGTAFGMEASLEGDDGGGATVPNSSYELESEQAANRAALESPLAWLSKRGH